MKADRKPALGFIFFTLILDSVGFGIIIPILPVLISHLTNSDLSHASLYSGWLMFSFAIMQFLFAPVLGMLSDRFGRRPILLISLFGFGVNYLVLTFAPSIGWLFFGRMFAGIMGASFTTASAYIADISTPEKRAQNFGLVGAAFGLGFILGPVIGGVLGGYDHRLPFITAAGLTFLNLLYGYFILPESLPKEHRRQINLRRANPIGSLLLIKKYPTIAALVVASFCLHMAGQATNSTWTFYTMEVFHWNTTLVGYSLGVVGIMMALVQGWLIRIINPKLGTIKSVFLGLSLYAAGFFSIGLATQTWVLFTILIPFCLGGIAGPALMGLISNQLPSNEQGELQGALTSVVSLTSIIGPIIMTGLFSFFTDKEHHIYVPGAPFFMAALLTFTAILLVTKAFKKIKVH